MMKKELLLIPGNKKISIVNVSTYKLIRVIDIPDSELIFGICSLNENVILTGARNNIKQWKLEGDDLILMSKLEKSHDSYINYLLNMGNGYIASGGEDYSIKIW